MKLLLTGAQGQVGWEFNQLCQHSAHQLIALGSKELDIGNQRQVEDVITLHAPDIVINAAAYTAVDKAESEPELAFRVNRDGPAHLADVCKNLNIPLLHISTDYVFDGKVVDGKKSRAYAVDDAVNPQNVYGASKWAGEEQVRKILPQHIILRTSWVFSSHGNNFVKTMLRLGQTRNEINVVADQWGAPTSAASIARCLLELCQRYEQTHNLPWGTYHFTGSPESTWFDFAQIIFKEALKVGLINHPLTVHPITTAEYPTPALRPQNSLLDMQTTLDRLQITAPLWQDDLIDVLRTLKNTQ